MYQENSKDKATPGRTLADIFGDMTLDSVYKQRTANVLLICPPDLYIESTNEWGT
jgi:hypothetical protein